MRQSTDIIKSWHETIMDEAEEKLSDWERNFMDSIAWKVEHNYELTSRQYDILEKIYAEKTS